jgi:hypothetical protein
MGESGHAMLSLHALLVKPGRFSSLADNAAPSHGDR